MEYWWNEIGKGQQQCLSWCLPLYPPQAAHDLAYDWGASNSQIAIWIFIYCLSVFLHSTVAETCSWLL